MTHSLQVDGDDIEIAAYNTIIQPHFPSYEIFWQKFIVPLTHRPGDKQLKTDTELATIGKGHHDLCLAQLHYTVLRQLMRSHHLMQNSVFGTDYLIFSLSSLIGAQDCAFELLERFRRPSTYGPWLEKKQTGVPGGREAQTSWKAHDAYPLQDIRDYRNCLVHGRTLPGIGTAGGILVPKIGKETSYFDWRLITAASSLPLVDFDHPSAIIQAAFTKTVAYFEGKWRTDLLPNI